MASIEHPLLGDALHGTAEARDAADRLCLHACALEFAHPATGERVSFESATPFDARGRAAPR